MIFNDNTVDTAAQAMQALLSQQLSTVGYDKTLVYTITDDSVKDKGSYTVSDGSVSFTAYTEDTSYKKDDKVYITIPQGDFTQKKIIIGRYIDSDQEEKGVGYIAPKDRIVPIYTFETKTELGLIATGGAIDNSSLSTGPVSLILKDNIKDISNGAIKHYVESDLTRLMISVDLENQLSDYNIVSGDYGVRVLIISTKNKVEEQYNFDLNSIDTNKFRVDRLEITNKNMIGNIYNYQGILNQSEIYNIADLGNIVGIVVEGYQNNNFKSQTLNGIKDLDYGNNKPNSPNINFKNITLTFGYGQEEFKEDNILLLNPDRTQDEFYVSNAESVKNFKLLYIAKNEAKKYEYMPLVVGAETLELYEDSFEVEENKAGLGWKLIKKLTNGKDDAYVKISTQNPTKSIKVIKIIPKTSEIEEQVITSNILKFSNSDFSQNVSGLVWLECEQGTNFDFYGSDYRIKDRTEVTSPKTIKATLADSREYKQVKIQWIIPTTASMFQHPEGNQFYQLYQPSEEGKITYEYKEHIGQYIITAIFTKSDSLEIKLGFGLREFYVPTFTNNQIICRAFYDGDESYWDEGKISFQFGQFETAGTEYEFALFFDNPDQTCLYPTEADTILKVYPYLANKTKTQEELNAYLEGIDYTFKDSHECLMCELKDGKAEIKLNKQILVDNKNEYIPNILVGTVKVAELVLTYELPIPIGVVHEDASSGAKSKPMGVQAPTILRYSSQGDPLDSGTSMALKLYGVNIEDETQTVSEIDEDKEGKSLYCFPTGQYNILAHNQSILNQKTDSKWFYACDKNQRIHTINLTLKQGKEITVGETYYLHFEGTFWKNNWYKIGILAKESDNSWLVYYLGGKDLGGINRLFGDPDLKYSLYTTDTVTEDNKTTSLADSITLGTPTHYPIVIVGDDNSNSLKIKINNKDYAFYGKFTIGGTDYNETFDYYPTYNSFPVKDTYLDIRGKTLYAYYFFDEAANDIIRTSSTNVITMTNNYTQILENDTTSFEFNFTDNLKSTEVEVLETLQESVNMEPYLYLSFKNEAKNLLKSTRIDMANKIAYFNFEKTMPAEQEIYIYYEEIKQDWIETNLGHIDYFNLKWQIKTYQDTYKIADNVMGFPLIKTNQDGWEQKSSPEYYLQPYPFYQHNSIIPYLEGYIESSPGTEGTVQQIVLWRQPIIVKQDLYGYPLLNEWDGTATTIKDSSIMSPCIGAGSKNDDNTFNGVLMGKIQNKNETKSYHGLYGFNKGEEVFGFKEDGTAFIGKSSGGRILFDGNESTIKSASYDTATGTGLLLDLDNPIFDLKLNNKSLVKFNPNPEDNNSLEMYLQTKDYDGEKNIGTRLDLINGYLKMNGKKTETKNNIEKTYSVSISNDPNGIPIQVLGESYDYEELSVDEEGNEITKTINTNKEFKVDWNGSLSAVGADIKGDLTAGTVGGWNIATNQSTGKGWLGYTATFNKDKVDSGLYEIYSKAFIDQLMKLKFQMRFNKQSVIDADWNGEFGLPGNFNIFNIKTYYKKEESPEIPDYEGNTWKNKTVESICESIFKDSSGNAITEFEMPSVIGDGEFGSKTYTKSSTYLALFKTMAEALDAAIEPYTDALTGIGKKKKDQITGRFYTAILQQISSQSKYYNPGDISNINKDKESNEAKDFDWKDHLSTSSNIVYWISPVYLTSLLLDSTFDDEESKKAWLTFTLGLIALQNGTIPISISSQGNIKTRGSLVVGGEASGTKIWALNANAKKWKIKYGDNSSEHDFFGVALPFSTSDWGQGIRFNGGYKSILLNGSGIRFYNWGTTTDDSGESFSKWIHQGTWRPGKNQGIKLTYGTNTAELYCSGEVAHVGYNREKDNGAYITFGQSGMALKSYTEKTSSGDLKSYITFHRGSDPDEDPSYIAIRGSDDKVYYAFLANYKPGITKA